MATKTSLFALLLIAASMPALALDKGDAVPALALPAADGTTVDLASLRGQVVLVDFWASWCGPCRESFPWFAQLHERLAPKGLRIVAISLDEERSEADRFLASYPAPFTVLFDPEQTAGPLFALPAMPTSYLVGRDGIVRARHAGFRAKDREVLESEIAAALAEPAP
ncbi:MAG TPA: TlpA disulfide reductase family protein [Xanthomonadales bacterium]|nr:TlpA disulfide reductase family protein [Xanthomonadales bacterium]